MHYFLAIDIGASSGRHIVGWKENGIILTQEVYRFPNQVKKQDDFLTWDIDFLFAEVKKGIAAAFSRYKVIDSLAIDTWGVDYVLLDADDRPIPPCVAYRDRGTERVVDEVHLRYSFSKLYERTGIQYQPFNSVYRLWADKVGGRLDRATSFLMIPEYLSFLLTGSKKKEYTNATTTGLVNAGSCSYDEKIIAALDLPSGLFTELSPVGTEVGDLLPSVAEEVGGQTKVVLCASHDTASAFEAVDSGPNDLILSSGTWSLLGAKLPLPNTSVKSRLANFTNEGGIGYIRFLKNIMGLWIIGELKKEFGADFPAIVAEAEESSYEQIVDVNDSSFLAPECMSKAVVQYLTEREKPLPEKNGDLYRCVFCSLAKSYADAIKEIEEVTEKKYSRLFIVGGGAKNALLNRLTEEYCKIETVALPVEATAIGNLKIQMRGLL